MNKSIKFKSILMCVILIISTSLVYADLWTPSQPSHQTLYADTITSKTDASSVNIADSQGLFVTGDITTLGRVGIGTANPATTHRVTIDHSGIGYGLKMVNTGYPGVHLTLGAGEPEVSATGANLHVGADSTHQIRLTIGGGEKLVVASSGNVGIGTTGPSEKLDVVGNIQLTGTLTASTQVWGSAVGSASSPSIKVGPSTFVSGLFQRTGGELNFVANLGERMRLIESTLYVPRGNAATVGLGALGGAFGSGLFWPPGDHVAIATGGVERLRVTYAGNVGIGTASPADRLQVNGNIRVGKDNYISSVNNAGTGANVMLQNGFGAAEVTKVGSGSFILAADAALVIGAQNWGGPVSGLWVVKSFVHHGPAALFMVAHDTVVEISDPINSFSTTQGTPGSANFYITGGLDGNLMLENKLGGAQYFTLTFIGGT